MLPSSGPNINFCDNIYYLWQYFCCKKSNDTVYSAYDETTAGTKCKLAPQCSTLINL